MQVSRRQHTSRFVLAARAPALALVAVLTVAPGCDRRRDEGDAPVSAIDIDPDQLRRMLVDDGDIARLTDRSLDAYERATRGLEAAGSDCIAAARALRRVLTTDGIAIARAKKLSDMPDLLARARGILLERMERTRQLTNRFDQASSTCGAAPGVAELLSYF